MTDHAREQLILLEEFGAVDREFRTNIFRVQLFPSVIHRADSKSFDVSVDRLEIIPKYQPDPPL